MQLMPNAVPISDIKNKPSDVLGLVKQGPVLLTTRGTGVAVITDVSEWNAMAQRLARLERLMRLDETIKRNDVMDYEHADAD